MPKKDPIECLAIDFLKVDGLVIPEKIYSKNDLFLYSIVGIKTETMKNFSRRRISMIKTKRISMLKVLLLFPLIFISFSHQAKIENSKDNEPILSNSAYAYADLDDVMSLSFSQKTFTRIASSRNYQNSSNHYRSSGTSTGLIYFGARYYDPAIGRFITPDPVEGDIYDPRSLNRYAYGYNNPLRYVDPWGLTVTYADKRSENLFNSYYSSLPPGHTYAQDVKALIDSDVEYHIIFKGKHRRDKYIGGRTFVMGPMNTNRFNVQVYDLGIKHWTAESRLAHELRHAVQFEKGQIAYVYSGSDKKIWNPAFYDIYDEVDAFDAQILASQPSDLFLFKGRLRDYQGQPSQKDKADYLNQRMGYGKKNLFPNVTSHPRVKYDKPGSYHSKRGEWWHIPYQKKQNTIITGQTPKMVPNNIPTPFIQLPTPTGP